MIDEEMKPYINGLYINESMSHLWKVLENDSYSLLILRVLNFRKVLVGEIKTEFKRLVSEAFLLWFFLW